MTKLTLRKLFKPYIVKRKNGQCQILIPLIELDELCKQIEGFFQNREILTKKQYKRGVAKTQKGLLELLENIEYAVITKKLAGEFLNVILKELNIEVEK